MIAQSRRRTVRLAAVFLTGVLASGACASGAWASDAFVGDWKLDVTKSTAMDGRAPTNGRALIEPDNSGGYLQITETIFQSGSPLRFNSQVQFNETPGYGMLGERLVEYSSKKISQGAFEISVRDRETHQVIHVIRAEVATRDPLLTVLWSDAKSAPLRKLVYQKVEPGPLLKTGKTVQHEFGAASVLNFGISLKAGQFCTGKVEQEGGTVDVAVYEPDGARMLNVGGPPSGTKTFTIAASVAGIYRITLRSPASPAKSVAITMDKIVGLDEWLHAEPRKEKFTSPRIAALRKKVEAGESGAVATFWRDLEKEGTPIIEHIEGNNADNLVTFLWRATTETRNVRVLWPCGGGVCRRNTVDEDFQMMRLANTDVWYRTFKIRRGARFSYQLSPNNSLRIDDDGGLETISAQADPLNPHHFGDGPGASRFEYESVVEMPDARPQPYTAKRAGVPAGTIEKKRIRSELLGNERDLSVYTPPGYRRDGPPNGLLLVFDEGAYLTLVPTPVILDNLLSEKKIPAMVAVLIANPSWETREKELLANPTFADFLNDELVPWIRQNYNIAKDPAQTVVAGLSDGGFAAAYAGLRHPETFGNILSQSGSFWWASPKFDPYEETNYLAREFVKSPKLPLKFHIDVGFFERALFPGDTDNDAAESRLMRDVLLAKGYEVHYQENIGGHDFLSWPGSLADGLIALVGTGK
jgi:enterochelin esterase family protein